MSATCAFEGTNVGRMSPALTLSLTKWQSISMCLVLACWTGLEAKDIEEALSHRILIGVETGTSKSLSRHLIQETSHVVSARDLYSASVEDLETTFCFLDCHEMRLLPRKTQLPDTDLLE